MTDWTGSGSTIVPVVPAPSAPSACEWVTVDNVREEFGADVASQSDAQILRKLDRLAASLTEALGHGFGRALLATSTAADGVAVTATVLSIGGVDYAFATYPTLGSLVTAVNAAGGSYSIELWPTVNANTPSTLLALKSVAACGPTYDHRQVLCMTGLWVQASGDYTSHLFLPLSLTSVSAVTEDAAALLATYYWAVPGDTWLIRKACSCITNACRHPSGRWPATYPGNLTVSYVPQNWGNFPGSLRQILLDGFATQGGLTAVQSESFGEYSYSRGAARVDTWQDTLSGSGVRRYATRFQP